MTDLTKPTSSQRVLIQLIEYISAGGIVPGTVLTGEVELCRLLGVGRSAVREAIAFLKAFGIVSSHPGVGLVLSADPRQLDLLQFFVYNGLNSDNFRQIKQLRDFIEIGSAHLIIRNALPADIQELRFLIAKCEERELSPVEFEIKFHGCMARLSGNRYAVALSLTYRPLFEYHIAHHPLLALNQPMPEYILDAHRMICNAIEQKNIDRLLQLLHEQAKNAE